jgi:hypothetical protein
MAIYHDTERFAKHDLPSVSWRYQHVVLLEPVCVLLASP